MLTFNEDHVAYRIDKAEGMGYRAPKWLLFCRVMLRRGFTVHVHEAKSTVSKYVYIQEGERMFKVRFSNHSPNWRRADDCDFVVGLTDRSRTTTAQAIAATLAFFDTGERAEFITPENNPVLDEL